MNNYDEFIKRLEEYEKTIDEIHAARGFDTERLMNKLKMTRARMVHLVKNNIKG